MAIRKIEYPSEVVAALLEQHENDPAGLKELRLHFDSIELDLGSQTMTFSYKGRWVMRKLFDNFAYPASVIIINDIEASVKVRVDNSA